MFIHNYPTHQVRHICKAHKANTQKPTLQKSLPCANAHATLCGWTQTHIVDDRGERANVQQKYCCNWGLTEEQSSAVQIQALVPADGILLGSNSKHQLLVINLASVPGGQLVNSQTAQSLELCRQLETKNRVKTYFKK